jgi:hypothetical protein
VDVGVLVPRDAAHGLQAQPPPPGSAARCNAAWSRASSSATANGSPTQWSAPLSRAATRSLTSFPGSRAMSGDRTPARRMLRHTSAAPKPAEARSTMASWPPATANRTASVWPCAVSTATIPLARPSSRSTELSRARLSCSPPTTSRRIQPVSPSRREQRLTARPATAWSPSLPATTTIGARVRETSSETVCPVTRRREIGPSQLSAPSAPGRVRSLLDKKIATAV